MRLNSQIKHKKSISHFKQYKEWILNLKCEFDITYFSSLYKLTYAKQARAIVNSARVNEDPKARMIRGNIDKEFLLEKFLNVES